jgi:hypothetical protein
VYKREEDLKKKRRESEFVIEGKSNDNGQRCNAATTKQKPECTPTTQRKRKHCRPGRGPALSFAILVCSYFPLAVG